MKLISKKLNFLITEFTWNVDDNPQHERLHDEIKRLSLENEMLKKGNWFTALLVHKASAKLLALYKTVSQNPIQINIKLPELPDEETLEKT